MTPPLATIMAGNDELPKGALPFHQLPISKSEKFQFLITIMIIISLAMLSILSWISFNLPFWSLLVIISFVALLSILFLPNQIAIMNTPLAVNLNHPFVDDSPIGNAEVYVKLSDGDWIKSGNYRVRINRDDLIGGYSLVEDNEDYSVIGHFSSSNNIKILQTYVTIINQALSLRDAVNEEEDSIENAREREEQETGLLDREWMEEEEIPVSGPISRLIGRSE